MANQQQSSNTPFSIRDKWETPKWLFAWIDDRFRIEVDLAASPNNAKKPFFISEQDNSLDQSWAEYFYRGFCNPPYSETGKWLEKAWHEARNGFRSVLLVPTPNGEEYWRDHVFGKASEIFYINGRISFVASEDFVIPGENGKPDRSISKGQEVSGNSRGSCLVVYQRDYPGHTFISDIDRDAIRAEYDPNFKPKNRGT